jgi:predicted Zn-dependent protease
MTLAALDTAAVARALALVATRADDLADAYFEERTDAELPTSDGNVGPRLWRERGLAVRLVRGASSWLASRDALDAAALTDALRSVARSVPPAFPAPAAATAAEREEVPYDELGSFAGRLERALRRRYVAFPYRLATRWHARSIRVVTPRTASEVERERFASVDARTPWGRAGALSPHLDDAAAERFAERLAGLFRARDAAPPAAGHPPLLLRPGATAVALHECVAHALEADLLAWSGSPLAADGVELGASELDVLDDPAAAPAGVARRADDEGSATTRRWLLRRGRVAQPIADLRAARRWGDLLAGSGFRADRHAPPLPRSHHLELLPGAASDERLHELAQGGLEIAEIAAGTLDPASGEFVLEIPYARRLHGGEAGESVGPFRVRGHFTALLGGVVAVGVSREAAGAGWCAKGGQRRAVWATAPAIVVAGLEVVP